MFRIFISYRRNDSPYACDILVDELKKNFGEGLIFRDVDDIDFGTDFRKRIEEAVSQCDVLLAIIGDEWSGTNRANNSRRIDAPDDWVRIEIESALRRNIHVIPVLVDGAEIPSAVDLPESIRDIVHRHSAEVRPGPDLQSHISRLLKGLEKIRRKKDGETKTQSVVNQQPTDSEYNVEGELPVESYEDIYDPALQRNQILTTIQTLLGTFTSNFIFVAPNIPEFKLQNAFQSYAPDVSPPDALLLYDNTPFGAATAGLLLTVDAVYWRNTPFIYGKIFYKQIQFVQCNPGYYYDCVVVNGMPIGVTMGEFYRPTQVFANIIYALSRI